MGGLNVQIDVPKSWLKTWYPSSYAHAWLTPGGIVELPFVGPSHVRLSPDRPSHVRLSPDGPWAWWVLGLWIHGLAYFIHGLDHRFELWPVLLLPGLERTRPQVTFIFSFVQRSTAVMRNLLPCRPIFILFMWLGCCTRYFPPKSSRTGSFNILTV